jgi:hypothetical protein
VWTITEFGWRDPARATWGAAWDLLYLRPLDPPANVLDPTMLAPVLVTADRGIVGLRERCYLPVGFHSAHGVSGFARMSATLDRRLARFEQEVDQLHAEAMQHALEREWHRLSTGQLMNRSLSQVRKLAITF